MGENTGLILFLWIVGAPAIGIVVLSWLTSRRSAPWEVAYGPVPRNHAGAASERDRYPPR